MNFRARACPWKQLLISEVKQLIIINNATRSPRVVSQRRRGARAIELVWHRGILRRPGPEPAWPWHPWLPKPLVTDVAAPSLHPGDGVRFWLAGGAGARRRSEEPARDAKFLSVHLYLIALCPAAHDLIIFMIASASFATNLIDGNKIIQPSQKMQP